MRTFFVILLALVSGFLGGCCSTTASTAAAPAPAAGQAPASVRVIHVLTRGVPATIDSFRFTGVDENGQVVFGPIVRERAADITFTPVPLTCRGFQIEYLSGGQVVGIYREIITLQPGQTYVINGPEWQDVVPPGQPAGLVFFAQPVTGAPGAVLNPVFQVVVVDANLNVVTTFTGPITLSVATGPGTIGGTVTVNAVGGIATYSDITLSAVGTYTLNATAAGLPTATSRDIVISAVPIASRLSFTVQPSNAVVNAVIAPAVQVTVLDQFGNPFTNFNAGITLAIGTNPTVGAALGGTVTVNAVNGVATFNDLSINRAGVGYTLIASSTGLVPATSNAFNITAAPFTRPNFSLSVPVGIAAGSESADVADINQDGRLDVITASQGEQEVYVLLARAEGDYAVTDFGVANLFYAQFGNFNNDAFPDIATVSYDLGVNITVQLWMGNGTETFAPSAPQVLAGSGIPSDMRVADVNSDGTDDVVVAGAVVGGGRASVFLTMGGNPDVPVNTALGVAPQGIALGNLLGDANLDLVVGQSGSASTSVLIGDGSGAFGGGVGLLTNQPFAVAIADLDGLNGPDVIVFGRNAGARVTVFLNDGVGGFAAGVDFNTQAGTFFFTERSVATGDLNGDGVPDVAYVDRQTGLVVTYLTDRTQPPATLLGNMQFRAMGDSPTDIFIADLNGDGMNDVGASMRPDFFVRMNGRNNGDFLPIRDQGTGKKVGATGDVNGDGRDDLVVLLDSFPDAIEVYLNTPGGLPAVPDFNIFSPNSHRAIRLVDFDRDGDLDFVGLRDGAIGVHLNPGNGNFSAAVDIDVTGFSGGFPDANFVAIDLNGDLFPDLANSDPNNNQFRVALSAGAAIPNGAVAGTVGTIAPTLDIKAADFDQDGDNDLVCAMGMSGIGVFRNDGVGGFGFVPVIGLTGGDNVTVVAAGNLNADAFPDILAATAADPRTVPGVSYSILHSTAQDMEFPTVTRLTTPELSEPREALIVDLNNDGINDLVVVDRNQFAHEANINSGDGINFENSPTLLHMGGFPAVNRGTHVMLIDRNGDGTRDLLYVVEELIPL